MREWKKFTNHPNYEYYSPKLTPTPTTFNKYSKEAVAANHSWYKQMLQSARIREKKVMGRLLKRKIKPQKEKKKRKKKNACYWTNKKGQEAGDLVNILSIQNNIHLSLILIKFWRHK